MNNLTADFIAIDTNVFEHLFNSQENRNNHIDKLLGQLFRDGIKLLVDKGSRITNEYKDRLGRRIRQMKHSDKGLLLKHWIDPMNHNPIPTPNDNLRSKIKQIVRTGASGTDITFVYVALSTGKVLITNDKHDIIDEGTKPNQRRQKLLTIPKKIGRKNGADILTSEESYARIAN